jgi:hypothetical protein
MSLIFPIVLGELERLPRRPLHTSGHSRDVYVSFGRGVSSPIQVSNPQARWDKYRCGKTLYWRVWNHDRTVSSSIQTKTTFACGSSLSVQVNPLRDGRHSIVVDREHHVVTLLSERMGMTAMRRRRG